MLGAVQDRHAGPTCPTCHRPAAWTANPVRPFSTLTCRLVDLRWLDEDFRGPGEPQPVELAPDRRLPADE